jgi:hypothetical protein
MCVELIYASQSVAPRLFEAMETRYEGVISAYHKHILLMDTSVSSKRRQKEPSVCAS